MENISNEDLKFYEKDEKLQYSLMRIKLLKETINELKVKLSNYEKLNNKDLEIIDKKISDLRNNPLYEKKLEEDLEEEKKSKNRMLQHRINAILPQLTIFEEAYDKLCNETVEVRCKDLLDELDFLTGKKIHCNLSIDIISFKHNNLHGIMKENNNRENHINLTISDKKHPEYNKELNNILYINSFPIKFDEIENDGFPLLKHIELQHGFTFEGKRYTILNIKNIKDINIRFKLKDLVEDTDDFKPVELLKVAISNCKKRELKSEKGNQKVKRI